MGVVNKLLLVTSTNQVAGREWPSKKGVLDFWGSGDPSNCPIIIFFSERVYIKMSSLFCLSSEAVELVTSHGV